MCVLLYSMCTTSQSEDGGGCHPALGEFTDHFVPSMVESDGRLLMTLRIT